VRDVSEHTRANGVLWLDQWIRGAFAYRPEIEEIVRTPEFMLDEYDRTGAMDGDCDDVTTLLSSVLHGAGYPVRIVAMRNDAGNPSFTHVVTEVWDGDWKRLDPTVEAGTVEIEYDRMEVYV